MLPRLNLVVVFRMAGLPERIRDAYFKMTERRAYYLKDAARLWEGLFAKTGHSRKWTLGA